MSRTFVIIRQNSRGYPEETIGPFGSMTSAIMFAKMAVKRDYAIHEIASPLTYQDPE